MYISILQINVFDINFLQYLTQTKRRNGIYCRVAEVVRRHEGLRRKVWTRTKILSPNIHYFVVI